MTVDLTPPQSTPAALRTDAASEAADSSRRDELVRALRSRLGVDPRTGRGSAGEPVVDGSTLRRAEYSTDASNYRVVPDVVVLPRDVAEAEAVAATARELAAPLTARGAGTSCAGNAVGPGVVIDFSRHVNRVLEIDPEARTARVEPGVIMSSLQKQAAPHGLRFGPDPSTQNRATLGGMIGNNACGPHAVAYGRTADNVRELEVVDGLGRRYTAASGDPTFAQVPGLADLVRGNLALLRTELGRFGRQVSGYSLEHLLPENGSDLAKMLVGSEGTLVTVLGATLDLVPVASAPTLVVLGYPDMATAADHVPALLAHHPLAIEGLDARLVDVVRRAQGAGTVPELPRGGGWLMVEVGGATPGEALDAARALAADAGTDAVRILPAGPEASAMWQIRADGAGLAGRTPDGRQAWPGWEDSAVPPAQLGAYLRDLEALMASYGVDGLPYGHFGDGCVHLRLDIPLETSGSVLRTFMTDAAMLVARYGGSLSGEHGDGRARSELLPVMYSAGAVDAFAATKALFDPRDLLNPGVLVRPDPLDAHLRRPQARPAPATPGGFSFRHDDGDLTKAVHRCVGVGKCRADTSAAGGFMCPSYRATQDEKDVTRGRARVLQEMLNGSLVTGSWRSEEVHDALDLCLACKACSQDCPAGVDMAQYKSEVLYRGYKGRVRPVTHYVLGWLPRWLRVVGVAPRLVNRLLSHRWLAKAVLWSGGMDPRRGMLAFAETPFREWYRRGGAHGGVPVDVSGERTTAALASGAAPARTAPDGAPRPRVVLWTDSFSDGMDPQIPQAALQVLDAAGYDVVVPGQDACCGLTWITTGQLDGARKRLEKLLGVLGPFAVNGIPIVGLEPSCTAVLRSDLVDLFPDDPRAHAVAGAVRTVAELLTRPDTAPLASSGWHLPDLSDVTAVVQPHCHQHSVLGFQADEGLLRAAGAEIDVLAGCCGLAGNWGMEKGHYDVSVQVAENALLPALRAAGLARGSQAQVSQAQVSQAQVSSAQASSAQASSVPDDAGSPAVPPPGDDGRTRVLLADGFSCRTQARDLAGTEGRALVQLLAERLAPR